MSARPLVTRSFVAPLYGTLMAIGLQEAAAFFPEFPYAIGAHTGDLDATLDLLSREEPERVEVIERLNRFQPEPARTNGFC